MYSLKHCVSFLLLAVLGIVDSTGELLILHSPKGINFKGHTEVKSDDLKEVFSEALGYSVQKDVEWTGIKVENPFSYAEALVTFVVPGIKTMGAGFERTFPLNVVDDLQDTYRELVHRTEQRYSPYNLTFLKVTMEDEPKVEGTMQIVPNESDNNVVPSVMSLKYLYLDEKVDIEFIRELRSLRTLSHQISENKINPSIAPALFWIILPNLAKVALYHGQDSEATEEAKKLLFTEILSVSDIFSNLYKEKVLITAVTSEQGFENQRMKRDTPEPEVPAWPRLNVADEYDEDFPVIFNIILWFSIVMVVSLVAIAMAIAGMDPGRDSIIYRMTSTRMKKDN